MAKKSDPEMYSAPNERKSVVAERFIRFSRLINQMIQLINTKIRIIEQLQRNLLMQSQPFILILVKQLMIKIQKIKLVILLEHQNRKPFLQMTMLQIRLKKVL